MSLQRKLNRHGVHHMPKSVIQIEGRTSTNKPDKGKINGSCNRTACQRPLAHEPVHQFMDGNFTGGPRLYYCSDCAHEFDKWDHRSGDPIRIKREPKS